jgi:hypothetical protein
MSSTSTDQHDLDSAPANVHSVLDESNSSRAVAFVPSHVGVLPHRLRRFGL